MGGLSSELGGSFLPGTESVKLNLGKSDPRPRPLPPPFPEDVEKSSDDDKRKPFLVVCPIAGCDSFPKLRLMVG